MSSEIDTTGVVTKISGDVCNVSITIDDEQRTFSCSKLLVYVCGYQCEGQLTALLDEGADVEVRYKVFNESIAIVAVWCGEVPEHLSDDSRKLGATYDYKGHVVGISGDCFLVQTDDGDRNVLINKEVIFRNGCRVKNASDLFSINESVMFDAIPIEIEHPSGAEYQATCAWVGQAPRLSERFGLPALTALDDPWDNSSSSDLVHGIVSVIPNEIVAFAEAGFVENSSKILLMRSSFSTGCGSIKDIVNVGDNLCMQVRFGYMFRNTKQWFAVRAWKDGREILADGMDESCREAGEKKSDGYSVGRDEEVAADLLEGRDESCREAGSTREDDSKKKEEGEGKKSDWTSLFASWSSPSRAHEGVPKRNRRRKRAHKNADDPVETETSTEAEENSTDSIQGKSGVRFDEDSPVLTAVPPLSGAISILSKDAASILFNGLKIAVDRKVFFSNGKPCSQSQFVLLLTTEIQVVKFEAVKTSYRSHIKSGFSHRATCVWVGERPSVTCDAAAETSGSEPEKIKPKAAPPAAEVEFDENSRVLFNDPPLSGIVTSISRESASIAYNDLNIYVSSKNCFRDSVHCEGMALSEIFRVRHEVNFEAVKTSSREGYSHEATCAWIGNKPSLTAVCKTLPPMDFSLLEQNHRVFIGFVRRFCLPKVALVVVKDDLSTVCLHVSAFGRKSKKTIDYATGKDCINQFVKLGDRVLFKITRVSSFATVLSATNVTVVEAGDIVDYFFSEAPRVIKFSEMFKRLQF